MKKTIIIITVILLVVGVYAYAKFGSQRAQAPTQTEGTATAGNFTGTKALSKQNSALNWTAQKTVLKEWIDKGTVTFQEGTLTFENGKLLSGTAVVDMKSIKATSTGAGGGQDKLTAHVQSADFFDVMKYPTAQINVRSVTGNMATADITIKDVTKEIMFPVTVVEANGNYMVSGKVLIDRSEFGVKFGSTSYFKDLADKAIIDNVFTLNFAIVTE